MKPSPLQLNHTTLGEIHVQPNEAEEFASAVNVTTTPSFGRNDSQPDQWQIKMRISFKGADKKPAQYEGHIDVMGIFTVAAVGMPEEQKLKLVAVTCPSMLYATAREVIAGLTARSVNGLFLLPSVSFTDQVLRPQESVPAQPANKQT